MLMNTGNFVIMKNNWTIEYFCSIRNKWISLVGFDFMSKTYAKGAWDMLKAHYNHKHIYRLISGDIVIETMGKQTVKLS